MPRANRYWLMKSEPEAFSFEDLWKSKKRTTYWDGVRNYQARNFMRDEMRVGDGIVYYHSNAKPPGVAGFAEVASEAYPDATQFDPKDGHFDPQSKREDPRWVAVEIRGVAAAARFVPLDVLRGSQSLAGLQVLQKGNRLSITRVSPSEWRAIRSLAGL